jgi:hypothetical protein
MEDRSMELNRIMEEIGALPRTKPFSCCGQTREVCTLDIYALCPVCQKKSKLRGFFPIGTEIQDVIDAVLKWMGTGKEFEMILQRKREIEKG